MCHHELVFSNNCWKWIKDNGKIEDTGRYLTYVITNKKQFLNVWIKSFDQTTFKFKWYGNLCYINNFYI